MSWTAAVVTLHSFAFTGSVVVQLPRTDWMVTLLQRMVLFQRSQCTLHLPTSRPVQAGRLRRHQSETRQATGTATQEGAALSQGTI